MATRKVLCTGNPLKEYTIAHSIQKIFPDAMFLHKSIGWDLTDESEITNEKLKQIFLQCNTFINASYIAPNIQLKLLELCNQTVKFCDVFNIGSTHEYDGKGTEEYKQSKLALRDASLRLNTFRFKTHHLILGHLKTDNSTTVSRLGIDTICQVIPWVLSQEFEIPIIAIDQPKQSW